MRNDRTVCRACYGSRMVTQECECPECDGRGYIEVDPNIFKKHYCITPSEYVECVKNNLERGEK